MLKKFDSKLGHWIILIMLLVIWGSSFILIKRGLDAFSFEQVATLRIFIASIFLAVLGRKFYTNIPIKSSGQYFAQELSVMEYLLFCFRKLKLM